MEAKPTFKRGIIAVIEYLLGFLALAVFAAMAFGTGASDDSRTVLAFKVASSIAVVELMVLYMRPQPANRLIVGANLWLLAGGLAAFTQQWWWLKGYQRLGESSLFISLLVVGVATTLFSPAGFVAANGKKSQVRVASLMLLIGVAVALAASAYFKGNVKFAAVLPVIALSWLNRFLRLMVKH